MNNTRQLGIIKSHHRPDKIENDLPTTKLVSSSSLSSEVGIDESNSSLFPRGHGQVRQGRTESSVQQMGVVELTQRTKSVDKNDITLTTHLTLEKLSRLIIQVKRWRGGPVSAAIYLSDPKDMSIAESIIQENSEILENTTMHVVWEERREGSDITLDKYPGNILRQIAMDHVESDYFLAIDVGLIPAENTHAELLRLFQSDTKLTKRVRSKTLLVLPAFELLAPSERNDNDHRTESTEDMLPRTKSELKEMMMNQTVQVFRKTTISNAHGPIDYRLWLEGQGDATYRIHYGNMFEAYVLGYRHDVPNYSPHFRGDCFDKISWFAEAHSSGYVFEVLRDHFVVNINNHPKKTGRKERCDEMVSQWARFQHRLADMYGAETVDLNVS